MKTLLLNEIQECIDGRSVGAPATVKITAVSTDSRTVSAGDLFFAIRGERFDGHDFVGLAFEAGAAGAVVERWTEHVPDECQSRVLIVDDTVRALCRLAGHYRNQLACTVIAVTGSNGKTTTREMIYHILSKHYPGGRSPKSFNNHIGVPITVLSAEPADQFLVAEAGSSGPGEIDRLGEILKPDIAVITTIAPSHLEGFGDLDHVAMEKAALADHVRSGGAIIVNGDHDRLVGLIDRDQARVIRFGMSDANDLRITQIDPTGGGIRFLVNERFAFSLPVPGRHNAMNCLAAIAVARRIGLEMDQIAADLQDFSLPAMRLEIERIGGFVVLNDAYNANPASMSAAIETLGEVAGERRKVFLCGDMLELGAGSDEFHRQLGRQIAASGIDVLVGVGGKSRLTTRAAIAAGLARRNVRCHGRVDLAGGALKRVLEPGDAILVKGSRAIGMESLVEILRKMESQKPKVKSQKPKVRKKTGTEK